MIKNLIMKYIKKQSITKLSAGIWLSQQLCGCI